MDILKVWRKTGVSSLFRDDRVGHCSVVVTLIRRYGGSCYRKIAELEEQPS